MTSWPPLLRVVLDGLLFSNLYVAVPITCLTYLTFLVLPADPPPPALFVFMYAGTFFIYGFHRVWGLHRVPLDDQSPRHRWARRYLPWLYALVVLAGLVALGSLLQLPTRFTVGLIPAGLIALGYTVPVIPGPQHPLRLRDIPLIKVVLIALVVTYLTAVLPLPTQDLAFYYQDGSLLPMVLERFLFILAITLPFDVRDVAFDRRSGLLTWPILLGAKRTLVMAGMLLLGAAGLAWWNAPEPKAIAVVPSLLAYAVTLGLVLRASPQRSEYYYSFLLEGTMILQMGAGWFTLRYWLPLW